MLVTSGRFAAYRPKLSRDEILNLPIPEPATGLLDDLNQLADLDERVFELFGLSDAERVLVEDVVDYTLGDFIGGSESRGRASTWSYAEPDDPLLSDYCAYLIRVLKAGFGPDRPLSATIFRSNVSTPYRLVAITLGPPYDGVRIEPIRSQALLNQLKLLDSANDAGGIFNRREARIYQVKSGHPTIYIAKPDEQRFWTRSAGLHDGDAVALGLFAWQATEEKRLDVPRQ